MQGSATCLPVNCKHIYNTLEFLEWLESSEYPCKPTTKDIVEKSLINQGLSLQDFIIIDYHEYREIIKRCRVVEYKNERQKYSYKTQSRNNLNLVGLHLNNDVRKQIELSVHAEKIKTVELRAPTEEEMIWISQHFKNITSVVLHDVTDDWLQQYNHMKLVCAMN